MMNFKFNKDKKDDKDDKEKDRDELLKTISLAHSEWKDKENFFEAVTDPDLIDYAIYEIEASRRKYIYLLKKMKETHEPSKSGDSFPNHG